MASVGLTTFSGIGGLCLCNMGMELGSWDTSRKRGNWDQKQEKHD